jgi:hypothetical protein
MVVIYDILKTGSRNIAIALQDVVISVNIDDISDFDVKPFLRPSTDPRVQQENLA